MSRSKLFRGSVLVAALGATSIGAQMALADDAPLPPAPIDMSSGTATVAPAPNPAPGASSPGTAAAITGVGTAGMPEVVPGPFMAERAAVLVKIARAKQLNFGIGGYLMAFNMLQDSIKAGASEADVKKRLDSISSGIDDQLARSKVLKTQVLPHTGGMPGGGAISTAGAKPSGGAGGGGVDQLLQKYGNKLPADVDKDALLKRLGKEGVTPNNINPDDLMKKYANDPRAKDLLEKLKGGL